MKIINEPVIIRDFGLIKKAWLITSKGCRETLI